MKRWGGEDEKERKVRKEGHGGRGEEKESVGRMGCGRRGRGEGNESKERRVWGKRRRGERKESKVGKKSMGEEKKSNYNIPYTYSPSYALIPDQSSIRMINGTWNFNED